MTSPSATTSPRKGASRAASLAWFALWSYAAFALALCALRVASGDHLWFVLVATHVAHLWLAPAVLVGIFAWIFRRRALAWMCVALALVLAQDCGPWLRGLGTARRSEGGPLLSVVSWNLGYAMVDVEATAAELRRLSPDLVLFQEPHPERFAELATRLADEYPFHGFERAEKLIRGKAWLSRTPVRESALVQRVEGGGMTNERGDLVLDFDGAPLHVSNVHTSTGIAKHGRSWWSTPGHLALARLHARRGSGLVVGDYNTTERSPVYHDLRATGLRDAYREVVGGPGFSFPVDRRAFGFVPPPFLRIDYLWHTADLACLHVEVGRAGGSDHLPLLGVFARRRGSLADGREPR